MNDDRKLDRIVSLIEGVRDELRGEIRASEKRMTARMDGIDQRFDQVDQRFDESAAATAKYYNQLSANMDERFAEQDAKIDRLQNSLNTMGGIAADYTALRDEELAGAALLRTAGDRIDDHEARIERLESAAA